MDKALTSHQLAEKAASTWRRLWAGDDQIVEFLLFTEGDPEPYRQLRLWLNVIPPPPIDN